MEDKFIGTLVGLAIGDALGMPFEGMSALEIKEQFGKIYDFMPHPTSKLKPGQYTDDTEMMICLAESIINSKEVVPEDVSRKYLSWYLSGDWRGIGRTTYKALLNLKKGISWQRSGISDKWSAGNGTAMRVAPIGLFDWQDLAKLKRDAELDAVITHNNPEAIAGSQAVAFTIARLVSGEVELGNLIDEACEFIGECELAKRLIYAKRLLEANKPPEVALMMMGTSGYVVETVPSALYCFLKSPRDFERTVISCVMAGGDTDAVAAIAGAISGAYNGLKGIPRRWVENVEDSQKIQALAQKLFSITPQ